MKQALLILVVFCGCSTAPAESIQSRALTVRSEVTARGLKVVPRNE
jgi:hypothetical protein